jgi:hypothetical protein
VQREWFVSRQLRYGAALFDWPREFTLWSYSPAERVLLVRSVGPATRIDLLFKPVEAVNVRTTYPRLAVRVARRERAEQVLTRLPADRHHRVLELLGPDGAGDHVVCMAVGCREDEGGWSEPSPFEDLT